MSEAMRLKILNKLASVIGEEEATHLMENIPPFDWHELATKEDLNTQSVLINAQFTKVAAEFTAVRGEFAEKIGGLSKEIGELSKEIGGLHKEIGGLHVAIAESSQRMSDKLDSMRRWVVGSVVAVVGAVVGSGIWFG